MTVAERPKLAVLTHMISPHTAPMYQALERDFDVTVIVSGHQDNRRWNTQLLGGGLRVRKALGITVKWRQRGPERSVWEERYTHFNPGYLLELVRMRPEAIFSHEMGFRTLAALIYGKAFGVPVWVFWEGPPHTERRISRIKPVIRRHLFARFVDRWVTCGRSSTEYLRSLGISRESILTAQNPVDEEPFRSYTESFSLEVPSPVALCVSRLTGLKGIDKLLDAVAEVQSDGSEFSLVIVGDGPEAANLKEQSLQLDIRRLQWIPYIPLEGMPAIYRSADFLIFPTLSDVWGLVVNEALWSGVPVIASKYAGAALDLLPKTNIFNPLDPEDLCLALRRALVNDIAGPEASPLMTAREVGNLISRDINDRLM